MNEYTFILAPNYEAYRNYLHENHLFQRTNIFLDNEDMLRGLRQIKVLCLPGWDELQDNHRILTIARTCSAEILEISERREIIR